jgi:hypothetical protein
MTTNPPVPPGSADNLLPTSEIFPKDNTQFLTKLHQVYSDISKNVNSREIARYQLKEIITGQKFFDTTGSQADRASYRTCYQFGAVPSGGSLTIAHGLTKVTIFTRIYGACSDTTIYYKPIPYVSYFSINYNIDIKLDATNIYIVNGTNGAPAAPALTGGIIVLEYLKT